MNESAGKVTITLSNGGGQQNDDMMVDYETVNGTAKGGSDFTSKSGTVTFGTNAPGELTFDVPITNDSSDEPNEQFTVRLSNVRPPSSCAPPPSITQMTAAVTIADNDPKPAPKPTPTQTRASTPRPTPSPSPSVSPTSSPTPAQTAIAVADESSGVSGGAVAGIVAAAVVVGGGAAFWIRRRFLT